MKRKRIRKLEETVFVWLMRLALLLAVGGLASILITIAIRGIGALNWAMLTQAPQGGFYMGKGGGILNAILGSIYLATGSTALSALIALPVVLYIHTYGRGTRLTEVMRLVLDVLWGTPSIVFGAFGLSLMMMISLRASLLAGIIALSLVILPILARTFDEVARMISPDLTEATLSLGATRLELSVMVLRQALPGLIAGAFLAFGRAIGDGASVLFTAGYTDAMPQSLLRPVASLPLAIFFQLGTPFPEVQARAHAAALVLTVIVLIFGLLGYGALNKLGKYVLR